MSVSLEALYSFLLDTVFSTLGWISFRDNHLICDSCSTDPETNVSKRLLVAAQVLQSGAHNVTVSNGAFRVSANFGNFVFWNDGNRTYTVEIQKAPPNSHP